MSFPFISASMNNLGHVHLFIGRPAISIVNPCNHTANGKESDTYLQSQESIDNFLSFLSEEQCSRLDKGYVVITSKYPYSDYHSDF